MTSHKPAHKEKSLLIQSEIMHFSTKPIPGTEYNTIKDYISRRFVSLKGQQVALIYFICWKLKTFWGNLKLK